MGIPETKDISKAAAWQKLSQKVDQIETIKELFAQDPLRGERLAVRSGDIYLDYSKNQLDDDTLAALFELAREAEVETWREAMFNGTKINTTENRAVLHTALRRPAGDEVLVEGVNVVPEVQRVLEKMTNFTKKIHSGDWRGWTGKRIKNIVNIGIGGSDLGPVMVTEALKHYSNRDINCFFVSNIDGTQITETLHDLDPSETLFDCK